MALLEEQPATRVLVVDDNWDIRDSLTRYLSRRGYAVEAAADAAEARRLMPELQPDVVLLDVMMPGEDGLSLCRSLAQRDAAKIILLTARVEDVHRIEGLESGADDYVCKPFNPRELAARIEAVTRRGPKRPQALRAESFAFDRWVYLPHQRAVQDETGTLVQLSAAEHRLLSVFVERPERVLSRDQILDLTRSDEGEVFDRSVDTQISRLRRKLERDPRNPAIIATVWGGGYSFTPKVERL